MPAIPRRHVPNNPPSLLGGGGFNFENKRGYSKPVWLNSVGKMAVVVALHEKLLTAARPGRARKKREHSAPTYVERTRLPESLTTELDFGDAT